jgi:hypothetical protein
MSLQSFLLSTHFSITQLLLRDPTRTRALVVPGTHGNRTHAWYTPEENSSAHVSRRGGQPVGDMIAM